MLPLKKIVLGVTGGIAAYKAVELARLFVRGGAEVQAVLTQAAAEFVTPLTFQTITGFPVYTEMYSARSVERVRHIELLEGADVLVIAPATANTVAKMARGIADNLLTTLYLAAACPVVVVPSMNTNMYKHPAVGENLALLAERGCRVMDPDSGELACGVYGRGRMPEPPDIVAFTRSALVNRDFQGIAALVTAGPTREPIDHVRFISNPSTGLMGYALARALAERGARVTLVSGPTHLSCPAGVERVEVNTAAEMHAAVLGHYGRCSLVIKAAAVSDFRPAVSSARKLKKGEAPRTIELEPTEDILLALGSAKEGRVLVGFAAETEDTIENARGKLESKNLDLVVANNLREPGAGFGTPTNRVAIIGSEGETEELPLMGKEELAHLILDRVSGLLRAG